METARMRWETLDEEAGIFASRLKYLKLSLDVERLSQLQTDILHLERSVVSELTKGGVPTDITLCRPEATQRLLEDIAKALIVASGIRRRIPDLVQNRAAYLNEQVIDEFERCERLCGPVENDPEFFRLKPHELLQLLSNCRANIATHFADKAKLLERVQNTCLKSDEKEVMESLHALLPGFDNARLTKMLDEVDSAEARLWTDRTMCARRDVQIVSSDSRREIHILEELVKKSEINPILDFPVRTFDENGRLVLDPRPPPSSTDLNHLKTKLQALLSAEEEKERAASTSHGHAVTLQGSGALVAADVGERRKQFELQQVALQLECRRYEGKLFDNEDQRLVREPFVIGDSDYLDRDLTDTDRDFLDRFGPTLFSRVKLEIEVPESYNHRASLMEISSAQQTLLSQNANEYFRGPVAEQQRKVSALSALGLHFTLVPSHAYRLGHPHPRALATGLDVAGSIDKSSRLDRRTNYWLSSDAPDVVAGIEFKDGPQHFMFTTSIRDVTLPSCFVSTSPVTVQQFMTVARSSRFRDDLAEMLRGVPLNLFNEDYRCELEPTMFQGKLFKFIERLTKRTVDLRGEDERGGESSAVASESGFLFDDNVAEVPYFAAEAFARAVGGYVLPVDAWEAMCVGIERDPDRHFLLPALDLEKDLDVAPLLWRTTVDKGTRWVRGSAMRIGNKGVARMRTINTPFGHRLVGRQGHEWNSALSFPCTAEDEAAPWRPSGVEGTSHVLRTCFDHATQTVFSGMVQVPNPDGGDLPFTETDKMETYQNSRGFSCPSFHTFSVPNTGVALGAFRICIPACEAGRAQMERSQRQSDFQSGRCITFSELLLAFGREQEKVFVGIVPERRAVDATFGEHIWHLCPAGMSLAFAPTFPFSFRRVHFFAPYTGCPVPIIEYARCSLAVATNSLPPVHLPLAGPEFISLHKQLTEAVSRNGSSVELLEDTRVRTVYLDKVTIPASDRLLPSTILQVKVTWFKSQCLVTGRPVVAEVSVELQS